MAKALETNTSLKCLSLQVNSSISIEEEPAKFQQKNEIRDRGIAFLAEVLQTENSTLRVIFFLSFLMFLIYNESSSRSCTSMYVAAHLFYCPIN